MATCPACQREVSQSATVECPFCGVIFSKWKGMARTLQPVLPNPLVPSASSNTTSRGVATPTAALPEESLEAPIVTALKPCPTCGRDLAGALVMEQICPYCSATLPDGFDPRPELPLPPLPLLPTPEELEFAARSLWKKVWARPWWAFSLSVALLGLNLLIFCVGDHERLASLSVPLIVVMAAVAPIVAMGACSWYNLPISLLLMGLCVVTFWRGWKTTWERDPLAAVLWLSFVSMYVLAGNFLFVVAKLLRAW